MSLRGHNERPGFGGLFASIQWQRQVGEAGCTPRAPGREISHRKLLESKRLAAFQNSAFLPVFGQARRWEQMGNTLRQTNVALGMAHLARVVLGRHLTE